MNRRIKILSKYMLLALAVVSCTGSKDPQQWQQAVATLDLNQGDIALCGSGKGAFGTVSFSLACSEKIREDFNLATALLHSFEYTEAEKVFARIIRQDPTCTMAYWGAAMCSFHPLWEAPGKSDLQKGARIITLARSQVSDTTTREARYLEAIASLYDHHDSLDHHTRLIRFEKASERIYNRYPDDREAAIFYALALRAAADPADKNFTRQKKAGNILNTLFNQEPNHPGVAHYIIHNFDYPELAEMALPAARKYASIAVASAHAQHMPSHIFTRMGLWQESVQANIQSIDAARCYAESMGFKGHWDEELHGLDYLTYAYLQLGQDDKALEQLACIDSIQEVSPINFKGAYTFTALPARCALERRQWAQAANLSFKPANFPWDTFHWEKANLHFARLLGAVHMHQLANAKQELEALNASHENLVKANQNYKANLVNIQIKAAQAWISFEQGKNAEAIALMQEAADMEDRTEKHPVTPGEILPARELLADLYMAANNPAKALEAYEADLKRHPGRWNAIYGTAQAHEKMGHTAQARYYYNQLPTTPNSRTYKQSTVARSKDIAAAAL